MACSSYFFPLNVVDDSFLHTILKVVKYATVDQSLLQGRAVADEGIVSEAAIVCMVL